MNLPSISDAEEKEYIIAFKSAAAKRRFLENANLEDRLITDSFEDDAIVVRITWDLANEISNDKKNILYVKERQPGALYLRVGPEEQARRKLGYSQYIPYVRNEIEARGKRLKEISATEALQIVDRWYRNGLRGNAIYATKAPTQLSRGHVKGISGPVRRQEFVKFWIATETVPSSPEDTARRKINESMRKHITEIRSSNTVGFRKIPATEALKMIERGDKRDIYGMRVGSGASRYESFFVREMPMMVQKTTTSSTPRKRATFAPSGGLDAVGIINEEYFEKILPRARLSSAGTSKEAGGEGFKFRSAQPTLSSAYLRPNIALGMIKQGVPVYGEQDDSGKWVAFYSKPHKALLKKRKKGKGTNDFTSRLIRMVLG